MLEMKTILTIFLYFLFLQSNSYASVIQKHMILGLSSPPNKEWQTFIKTEKPLGFILVGTQFKNANTVKTTINTLKNLVPNYTPIITIDQEGGRVNRIKKGVTIFPSAQKIASENSIYYTERLAYEKGKELKNLGIDILLGPVLDVNTNPKNPVIGDRSFSHNPKIVRQHAIASLNGYKQAGIKAAGKHFPGHGHTSTDTHHHITVTHLNQADLRRIHIAPFADAIHHHIPAIMVSHVVYPSFDPVNPASQSKRIISGLLREELGFKGIIITDDIMMKAITKKSSPKQAINKALAAGADYIIMIAPLSEYKKLIYL